MTDILLSTLLAIAVLVAAGSRRLYPRLSWWILAMGNEAASVVDRACSLEVDSRHHLLIRLGFCEDHGGGLDSMLDYVAHEIAAED